MSQLSLFDENADQWKSVRDRGGLFQISSSAGKDSTALYLFLRKELMIPSDQVVVVHADLGEIEWHGVQDYIRSTIDEELHVVRGVDKHGVEKSFLSLVENRGKWPSPSIRNCTSDLKTGPIDKFLRRYMKERGLLLAVNCMGLRAEESPRRSRRPSWALNERLSKAGREVYDWLPLHNWSTNDVYDCIERHGQTPHPAYGDRGVDGNERLSCVFCVMGSKSDHRNGAIARPELYEKIVSMEKRMGHTMFNGISIEQRNQLTVTEAYDQHNSLCNKQTVYSGCAASSE